MITIGLLTNGVMSANYGVNALSLSNILLIERACQCKKIDHQYLLFGDESLVIEQESIIRSIPGLQNIQLKIVPELEFRKISSFKSFIRNVKKCDLIFDTSGGDSYSDIYGKNRIMHQCLPKSLGLLLGKPLIFTPQTIGPFKHGFWKLWAGWILKKARAVFVRDHQSYEFCIQAFKLNNVEEVTDMAMILPYEKASLEPSSQLRVGLNVSGLLYHGGYTHNNQFQLKTNYHELVEKVISVLIEELDCEVHLIPHVVTTGVESDNEVSLLLKEKFPKLYYEEAPESAIEAKGFIAAMDLFMGARMHSTIGAISSGVAVLPLSYSRKFEGLFQSIDYFHSLNLREMTLEEIIEQIRLGIENIDSLRDDVKVAKSLVDEKIHVYQQHLVSILEKIDEEKR